MSLRFFIGLMCAGVLAGTRGLGADAVSPDPLAAIQGVPAGNPYRKPLEQWLRIPEAERKILSARSDKKEEAEASAPSLTSEQRARLVELAASLREAAGRAESVNWLRVPDPADPTNPLGITIPHVSPMIALGRFVTSGTADLPSGEAIDTYAAVVQMGRQARSGGTMIEHLTGMAIEGVVTAEIAKRLGSFSSADLDKLSVAWARLKPMPAGDSLFKVERDEFFRPFLEQIIKPGLAALIAEENAVAGTTPSETTGAGAELRLAAIINDGQRMIGLENKTTGASFWVSEGKTVNGVTLLSVDFERKRALLRIKGREVVVDLASKRLVDRSEAASRMLRVLGSMNGVAGQSAETVRFVEDLLERVRKHPQGVDGYIQQVQAEYDALIVNALVRAERPALASVPSQQRSDDPLIQAFAPGFGRVARRANSSELTATLFTSAVALRKQQITGGTAEIKVDPWSPDGAKLQMEMATDGGFILRSVYELEGGKPTTYKYAAPDAGVVK